MIAQEQARTFLMMALCGLACAGIHNTGTLLCALMQGGRTVQGMLDLGAGVLLAAFVTAAGLYLEAETLRLYVFVGAGMGAALWHMTFGFALRRMETAVYAKIAGKKAGEMQDGEQEKGK